MSLGVADFITSWPEYGLVEVDAWQIIQVRVIVWKELEGLMMDRKLKRKVLNMSVIP